jgi:phage FluMu gp28-like protein
MVEFASIEERSDRAPGVLLGYQQAWVEDLAQVKMCEKSRRIGLSWCEAADDALLASKRSGMDVYYIGYNKDMAQEFIDDCADWARFYNLAAGEIEDFLWGDDKAEDKAIQAFRIRMPSGFKVVALSSRPANLRGKQGKIVIDEAAFHDNLDGLLKAALAMLIWGGRVVIISTHNGDDNPFNELINLIRAGKRDYSLHRIDFDDALADGLYKRVCLRRGIEWSPEGQQAWRGDVINQYGEHCDEELFCVPSQGGGVYLPGVLVQGCMAGDIPVLRWSCTDEFARRPEGERRSECQAWCEDYLLPELERLNPWHRHYLGEDFARSGHLTVMWPGERRQDLSVRVPFAVELHNVPFRQQEQILFYIVDRLPRFSHGALDARGNGQYLAEVAMQRYGESRISQVMLSVQWYRENMPKYKALFEDRAITIAKDADVLDDHRAIKMKKGVAQLGEDAERSGKDKHKRHGDSAIAGAMLCFATNQGGGPAACAGSDPEPSRRVMGEVANGQQRDTSDELQQRVFRRKLPERLIRKLVANG